jgi:2-C-methyl-D-erythritol 4-phosphate cytidylyltransferase
MNGAVILAGGKGSRYKKRKQFELIDGIEMWKYVYDKVVQVVDKKHIVVVGVDTVGGETRSKSVAIGLEALQDECQRVIILEAARPLVTVGQIIKLLEDESKSTTYAMPLVNTVIGRDGRYYNRDNFYNLLTPQAFDFQMLRNAYRTGKYIDTTDETIVMSEEYGISPHFIVEGENLIKVTYQRDMAVVRQLLKQQEE